MELLAKKGKMHFRKWYDYIEKRKKRGVEFKQLHKSGRTGNKEGFELFIIGELKERIGK